MILISNLKWLLWHRRLQFLTFIDWVSRPLFQQNKIHRCSDIPFYLFFQFRGQVLKPSEKIQTEMFCGGLAEILFRVAEGNEAVFCLPGSDNCFEPSAHYGIDGVTEKVLSF